MIRSTHEVGPEARAEIALSASRVVDPLDPFEERDALRLALVAVALEEGVEDAGLGEAEMAVAQGELPQRLRRPAGPRGRRGRAPRRSRRGRRPTCSGSPPDIRARSKKSLAPRIVSPVRRLARAHHELDELEAEPVAGLLLQLPGAVLAPAAQVDDRAHALRLRTRRADAAPAAPSATAFGETWCRLR